MFFLFSIFYYQNKKENYLFSEFLNDKTFSIVISNNYLLAAKYMDRQACFTHLFSVVVVLKCNAKLQGQNLCCINPASSINPAYRTYYS